MMEVGQLLQPQSFAGTAHHATDRGGFNEGRRLSGRVLTCHVD
jgi:hypothetical protein